MVALAGRLESTAEVAAGHLTVPVQLFGEADNDPRFLAAFRLQKELAGTLAPEGVWLGGLRVGAGLAGSAEADTEWSALLGWPVAVAGSVEAETAWLGQLARTPFDLAGAVAAEAEWAGAALVPFRLAGAVGADGDFAAAFGFAFPEAGVVNLVPNPSAELGLSGWDGDLTRVAGDAWVGDAWVEWEVAAGDTATAGVTSVEGLGIAGGTWWAGVAMDLPAGVVVTPIVHLHYDDGTGDETQPEVLVAEPDEDEPPGPPEVTEEYATFVGDGLGWRRFVAPPLPADPAKRIDRVALVLAIDNAAGAEPVVVRLDGAMIGRFGDEGYVDGDQPGARWLGPAHASASVGEAA